MFQLFSNGSSSRRSLVAAGGLLLAMVGGTAMAQSAQAYPTGTGTTTCASLATQAPATLASYFTAYGSNPDGNGVYTGCTVGIATLYNFVNLGIDGSDGIDPAGIFVTPSVATVPFGSFALNVPTLSFSGPALVNTTNVPISLSFEYYIDPPIDILGLGLSDDPFGDSGTSVYVDLCVNNTFAAQSESNRNCPLLELSIFGGESPQLSDSTTFGPGARFVDVQTFITIAPGDYISTFSQTIPAQRVSDVPEPEQLALSGIGGLALFGALRTRRRRQNRRA